ncbi:MAG: hypothetical protein ACP5OZ_01280 [Candidatus Woesearchaeota archaeon]
MENSIGEPPEGTWFVWNNTINVKIPELIRREMEEKQREKNKNKSSEHFNPLKRFVSFLTLLVIGYNAVSLPRTLLGTEPKNGFVDGNKRTEFSISRKEHYSLSGDGLYSILNFDSNNKYDVVEIKDNLENKIEEIYAKDVISFGSNNKKIVVKKDFNDNYFLKDLSSKKESRIDLSFGEMITDIYVGKKIYLSSKKSGANFSRILVYDDLKKVENIEFYTGQSSVRDFEVKEGKFGVENILMALDNNQIRKLEKVGNKYVFKDVWKMNWLKNDVVNCATEVGSYIMFGTKNGQIGFFKKNNINEVYFLKLKEQDNFAVKELRINSINYDKKTNKTTVNFTAVRDYGVVDYSVKL